MVFVLVIFVLANSVDLVEKLHYAAGLYMLEKYLNLEGFLEKSLNIKSALKSTGKSLKSLGKSLNSTLSVGLLIDT